MQDLRSCASDVFPAYQLMHSWTCRVDGVEHYEIAAYGTARAFAEQLGNSHAAKLLQRTLDEEATTNEKLTRLAESLVNREAVNA